MNELITPTGIITGDINVLAIKSTLIRNAAPQRHDAGNTNLLSPPMIIRVMCGATNPTNAMVPVKQTIPAVASDATAISVILVLSTFMPRLFAVSSPAASVLRSHAFIIRTGKQHASKMASVEALYHVALPKLPIIHTAAAFNASGSAK